ncbi:MAG TPA: homoserine dehydrogenase [Armatimonadota bacterium]|jgi:homoserine dehydrogenase
MADEIRVGILGAGVVGCGTYQVLRDNAEQIQRVVGAPVRVTFLSDLDWTRPREVEIPEALRTTDSQALVTSPEVDIVVETIGGLRPSFDLVMAALAAGKSVVTSNKELMATRGEEILDEAAARGVDVQFEGAVGGVIPIIRSLKESLAASRVDEIIGIVNGTTNYILTRMAEEQADFAEVLAQAQALGYAEADPTADVEGIDAANKLAILSAVGFGGRVSVSEIMREGITKISPVDLAYARRVGKVVKLLAIGRRRGERLEARVHPTMIPATHPLAAVNGVFNAIFVKGPECGEVMLYGRGAGSLPTGAAVAGDVVDCARNLLAGAAGRVPCRCEGRANLVPADEIESSLYVRTEVTDRPGVLGRMALVFGEEGISIGSCIQESTNGEVAEIVWILHRAPEGQLQKALARIAAMEVVVEVSSVIRVIE